MSIQAALEQLGITKDDYQCLIKAKNVANRGNTAEVKRDLKNDCLKVYEVKKEKM